MAECAGLLLFKLSVHSFFHFEQNLGDRLYLKINGLQHGGSVGEFGLIEVNLITLEEMHVLLLKEI